MHMAYTKILALVITVTLTFECTGYPYQDDLYNKNNLRVPIGLSKQRAEEAQKIFTQTRRGFLSLFVKSALVTVVSPAELVQLNKSPAQVNNLREALRQYYADQVVSFARIAQFKEMLAETRRQEEWKKSGGKMDIELTPSLEALLILVLSRNADLWIEWKVSDNLPTVAIVWKDAKSTKHEFLPERYQKVVKSLFFNEEILEKGFLEHYYYAEIEDVLREELGKKYSTRGINLDRLSQDVIRSAL